MKRHLWIGLLVTAIAAGGIIWWIMRRKEPERQLTLYGNIDLRQVLLAFNNSERIAAVLVQEGDSVRKGDVLARLDTSRLEPQVAQATAQAAAQRQIVERLRHGSRPEEIAQARANVEAAKADAANAQRVYDRDKTLSARSRGEAISQQDLDSAQAALAVAEAKLNVNQKALELAIVGPRMEDIAEAEARLRGAEAQQAFLERQLADAVLKAPVDSVVRSRLMEPGEMATPQKPVFSLAVIDPKWVRAYVSEPDLGKVQSGMTATVIVDSFPDEPFEGWVGFISPVAEFTPKTVQTQELRTSLVYEVRVFVKDTHNRLRLGMPATVQLPLDQQSEQPAKKAATSAAASEPKS
jgi:HlyD family secretion protein